MSLNVTMANIETEYKREFEYDMMNIFENYQLEAMKVDIVYMKISTVWFTIFLRLQTFRECNEKYKSFPQVKEILILK